MIKTMEGKLEQSYMRGGMVLLLWADVEYIYDQVLCMAHELLCLCYVGHCLFALGK